MSRKSCEDNGSGTQHVPLRQRVEEKSTRGREGGTGGEKGGFLRYVNRSVFMFLSKKLQHIMHMGSGRPGTLDTRISCCLLPHTLGLVVNRIQKSWGTWSGPEVHGKSVVVEAQFVTQTGPSFHQSMWPEREYCFTCQRPVPYDRDTVSDQHGRVGRVFPFWNIRR
jgi:hypothetical protein